MSRRVVAPVLLLLAAAVSIAAVFAVQRIESRGGPLSEPSASTYFSPDGDGVFDEAEVRFTTRSPQRVDVDVVDARGSVVRSITRDLEVDGPRELTWDGTDEDGELVAEGEYRFRIRIAGDDRSYSPTQSTVLDVTVPTGRLDRWTWQDGELRGLTLLEPDTRLEVVDADGEPLEAMRAFLPRQSARSAQPEGPRPAGTIPVRFTVPLDRDAYPLDSIGIDAVDLAGNRLELRAAADAPPIAVLE